MQTPDSIERAAAWRKKGFLCQHAVVPDALVSDLRNELSAMQFFAPGVGLDIYRTVRVGKVDELVFGSDLLVTVREILGRDIVILPNLTARVDSQVPWHTDEAFRSAVGEWQVEDTSYLQCSIYLQDNDIEGGGLEVIPGSHTIHLSSPMSAVEYAKFATTRFLRVNSYSGALVAWDGRLIHRSSQRMCHFRKNYAFHWTLGRGSCDSRRVMQHLVTRGRHAGDVENVDRRYAALERFRWETDAPVKFVHAAHQNQIVLIDAAIL